MGKDDSEYDFATLLEEIGSAPEKNKEKRHKFLMSTDADWSELHPVNYLNLTGYLIDTSSDLGRKNGFSRAIELCENLLDRDLNPETRSRTHYQLANAYSFLGSEETNNWDNQHLESEIIHLRKGLSEEGVDQLSGEIECKMYTNLGNALSRLGRVVEAFEWWNRSLHVNSSHAMAKGNRGVGKYRYAMSLHDKGHFAVFLTSALTDLEQALKSNSLHPTQRQYFQGYKKTIQQFVSENKSLDDLESYSLGDSQEEINYREWCLENQLFLNPLNDITTKSIAGQDVLHLPDMEFEKPFPYPGLYNQMKQEYVSARYLHYQGKTSNKPHFSDKEVYLDNTLDYPVYSLSAEKMKTGLRLSYSIFDKIAFFINEYLDLGESKEGVNFSNIWFQKLQYNNGLRQVFADMDNWPFQALYWLRKDFYGGPFNVEDSIELIADDLSEIRNHLEHKYLKLHDTAITGDPPTGTYQDTLKFSISQSELEEAGIRMLKTARAGLIYLSLGIHQEEQRRNENRDDKPKLPIYSTKYEDDWKR